MSAKVLLRIASGLLFLFALGHTFGFLRFRAPTAEGRAVFDAMNSVHFSVGSQAFSYGGFYTGFGLFATAYLVFSAVLAWQLGAASVRFPDAIRGMAWSFFLVQIAGAVLSWIWFSTVPFIFSLLVSACIGAAAWSLRRPVPVPR